MSPVQKLQSQVNKLNSKINKIQEKCLHPFKYVTMEYDSNTGNYDPTCDCYWTNMTCSKCEKYWRIDGSVRKYIDKNNFIV